MKKDRRPDVDAFQKYLDGTISPSEWEKMVEDLEIEEIEEVAPEWEELLERAITRTPDHEENTEEIRLLTDRVQLRLEKTVSSGVRPEKRRLRSPNSLGERRRTRPWMPYAAAAVLLAASAIPVANWVKRQPAPVGAEVAGANEPTIRPASDRATIRLSDGRTIFLDGERDGIVIDGGQISYRNGTAPILELQPAELEFITVQTPRGGTYQVTLPDGTTVWLNAETTLQYPFRFNTDERVVHLEGEAYFNVERRASMNARTPAAGTATGFATAETGLVYLPFKVVSPNQTVEVLGTEFNVSAYADDQEVRTTLVNGKVSIHSASRNEQLVLYPGEQGRVGKMTMDKSKVDVADYIDWKHGQFVFRNETAGNALKQIARWYDVEIEYPADKDVLEERFSGTISRYDSLLTVLDIVREAGQIDFSINNRKVIIVKK